MNEAVCGPLSCSDQMTRVVLPPRHTLTLCLGDMVPLSASPVPPPLE